MNTPHLTGLRRPLGSGQPEVTCDACFAELDRYVDLELSGGDAEAAVPGLPRTCAAAQPTARST